MTHFIEGSDRQQAMLLPEHLDDYVDEKGHVRAIDAFADILDLAALGFDTQPAATGLPGYHPGLMLRIYHRADEVFEQTGTVLPKARMERTLRKLEHLQKEAVRYRSIEQGMDETGETQVS